MIVFWFFEVTDWFVRVLWCFQDFLGTKWVEKRFLGKKNSIMIF
jgi:hypothetical protein